MSAAVLLGAVIQSLLAIVVGWVVGDVLLHAAFTRSGGRIDLDAPLPEWVGPAERAGAALIGFVAFAVACMIAHVVTGGAVFGLPGIVPAAAFGVILFGARRHVWRVPGVQWRACAGAVALLAALYIVPAVLGGSSIRTGDDPWHLGWTEQLLHGLVVPAGPAPGDANAYPWGFHAVMATLVRMVPGTTVTTSLESLDMLIALALPLAAACLAKRIDPAAGWGAAAAGALIGGFGWIIARGPAFATSPRNPPFGADLVAASPNGVYELFPPPLPRELGLALLGVVGALLAVAARSERRAPRLIAGAGLGMVGLVSVPMVTIGVAWTLAVAATVPRRRLVWLGWVFAAAGMVFALWAGPVVAGYLRYGGFVNITPHLGQEWALPTALASWGLLLPLAVAGAFATLRRGHPQRVAIPAFIVASLVMLGLAVARKDLSWSLGGNATLLHEGRMWPPLHLLAAALAGVVLARLWTLVDTRRRVAGVALSVALLAVGGVSPGLASIAFTRVISTHSGGFIYSSPDLAPGSFVRRAAAHLGPRDIVLVRGAQRDVVASNLAFALFEFSGARLAAYENPELEGNDLRIRYRDLARRWERRVRTTGFPADYEVVPCRRRCPGQPLAAGRFADRRWALVRRTVQVPAG